MDPVAREDMRRWSRDPADPARDGVPAHAFTAAANSQAGRLRQRDFDLGRGIGLLADRGPSPALTAVLLTPGARRADWLRAGQALHRLRAHVASEWVFASLYSQPVGAALIRALIQDRLALPGSPQMLLQLGPTHSSCHRPPAASRPDRTAADELSNSSRQGRGPVLPRAG
jgi:hypothetical protein